jgi:hypothetical protein
LLLTAATLYFLFGLRVLTALGVASVLLGPIAAVAVMVLMALSPLGRKFPESCKTLGNPAQLFLARNYGKLAERHGMSAKTEAVPSLLQLIASETGSDVDKLPWRSRFPRDFTSIESLLNPPKPHP